MFSLSELGRKLKEERERKNLSLEDLQKETKIQKRYLVAIEEGNFDVLPGKFYARAFVRNYAEAVGIDPDQLFDELDHEIPNPAKEISDIPLRSERPKQSLDRKSKRKSSFINTLLGFVGVLILIIGIYIVVQSLATDNPDSVTQEDQEDFDGDFSDELPEEEVPNDHEDEVASTDEEQANEEQEQEEVVNETHQLQFIETVGNNSKYELSQTNQFLATIEFSGTSYVDIKNAKGHFFEPGTNKEAGTKEEYDFSEEEEIIFNFGASANVKLSVNGEHIPFPLDPKNNSVQRITVIFKGAKEE